MKKNAFALLSALTLSLASQVCAVISQQDATAVCTQYSLDGETLSIAGPINCEGSYWLCEFFYYGNKQSVLLAIKRADGSVLSPSNPILSDILSTRYAAGGGSQYVFRTFFDGNFAIQLEGMAETLDNYEKGLKSLSDQGYLQKSAYINLRNSITDLKSLSSELAKTVRRINNLSADFQDSPDCTELAEYLVMLNSSLNQAQNFSVEWGRFIEEYNKAVGGIEDVYVPAINPSDVRMLQSAIPNMRSGLEDYYKYEESFSKTATENLRSRFERRETKVFLDSVADAVRNSVNPEAIDRYNKAMQAYSAGKYKDARRLGQEAAALAGETPTNNESEVIIEKAPDYTIYFAAVCVLLAAIFLALLGKRRKGAGEDNGAEDRRREKKPAKRGTWVWTKEKESSMERKASDRLNI